MQIAKAKEEQSEERKKEIAFGTHLSCAVKISINTKYVRSDSAVQSIWETAHGENGTNDSTLICVVEHRMNFHSMRHRRQRRRRHLNSGVVGKYDSYSAGDKWARRCMRLALYRVWLCVHHLLQAYTASCRQIDDNIFYM